MDTSTPKPRKKAPPREKSDALKSAAIDHQLVLKSVDLIKVSAERIINSADAAKGVYALSQQCRHILTSSNPENPKGTFQYLMTLEGFVKETKSSKKHEKKSFSIYIELEASFDIEGGPIDDVKLFNSLTPHLVAQVHAVGTARITTMAADLGYPGVRPDLGIEKNRIPAFKIDDAQIVEDNKA
ncbi:hypothetical protein SAMN05880566_112186 [Janthinobacterium sp. TND4EL3]|uniref:hypothetical protein n=1 Tax=Janthinobacterium sp. TND4EL3 TaxID=1907311 RepID=UPI0009548342|nr:hypothetical protein [Janthinobacterium sp. TND4EL3]SIR43138.1 hypothetical protein SAMN05880566_112186 [Janthinobacterium sp. TND4EL3]